MICTYLKANIPSLTVFDNLRYVEATAKLEPPSDTETQAFTMRPIQTNLLQLPAQSAHGHRRVLNREREREEKRGENVHVGYEQMSPVHAVLTLTSWA